MGGACAGCTDLSSADHQASRQTPDVPEAWRNLCRHAPRPLQVEGLAALATGRDVVARLATGQGKSMLAHVAGAIAWLRVVRERAAQVAIGPRTPLPPLTVIVCPWKWLGRDQELQAEEYLTWLHGTGRQSRAASAPRRGRR